MVGKFDITLVVMTYENWEIKMFAFLLSLKQSTMRSRGPNSVIDIVPEEFLAGLITAEHVIDVLVIFFSNSFLFDCKRCYRSNTVTNHFIHN